MDWPDHKTRDVVPDWYRNCFRAALFRMSIAINVSRKSHDTNYPLNSSLLKLSDFELFNKYNTTDYAPALISFNPIEHDNHLIDNNEFNAENFFYGRFSFRDQDGPVGSSKLAFARTHVTYEVPQTFIDWSFRRLEPPRGTDADLEKDKYSEEQFVFECATNYLLKNFWHNFVHCRLQGITESNYGNFDGSARYDSDFEADNLATVFLILSYGRPVRTLGKYSMGDAIKAIWNRNRCNLVFQERASHRHQEQRRMTQLERFQEAEWRFFRMICNRLSIELISRGLAVRSLRVFANGTIKMGKIGFFRSGNVIVELNSCRYYTRCPVYVPPEYYGAKKATEMRLTNIRKFQAVRVVEIVTTAVTQYRSDLKESAELKEDAERSLRSLFRRLALPS